MPSEPRTMRAVVADLVAQNAEAIEELRELQYAVDVILRNFEQLVIASTRLYVALNDAPAAENTANATQTAIERAAHLNEYAQQIQAALDEVDKGLRGWKIPNVEDKPTPLVN